jgi:hypothetical protein
LEQLHDTEGTNAAQFSLAPSNNNLTPQHSLVYNPLVAFTAYLSDSSLIFFSVPIDELPDANCKYSFQSTVYSHFLCRHYHEHV